MVLPSKWNRKKMDRDRCGGTGYMPLFLLLSPSSVQQTYFTFSSSKGPPSSTPQVNRSQVDFLGKERSLYDCWLSNCNLLKFTFTFAFFFCLSKDLEMCWYETDIKVTQTHTTQQLTKPQRNRFDWLNTCTGWRCRFGRWWTDVFDEELFSPITRYRIRIGAEEDD